MSTGWQFVFFLLAAGCLCGAAVLAASRGAYVLALVAVGLALSLVPHTYELAQLI